MKKQISTIFFAFVVAVGALLFSSDASAEEFKMVGTVSKIEMAGDGKSANVVLKDTTSGTEVVISVTDDLTLDKFKDKRIVLDDEIRCRYDNETGKNLSKSFKKTAGC